ncbi:hypothetical protein [Gordonia sp. NB41Y]|uniref:hypothetical protein n=1 Tax=Gordonia sp. NB41Y TaxID=875808 RepID=UPI00273AF323|nr:hypothetical protein [Gordonia sp. NB41Y]WLP90208.1 hypothetical protein Q9K23_22265 [Gordonia sp. NB41Y]
MTKKTTQTFAVGTGSVGFFSRRVRTVMTDVAAGALGLIGSQAAPAQAIPGGTVEVVPSMAACGDRGFEKSLQCGAAFTDRWLDSWGASDVVEATVVTRPDAAGVYPSRTTDGVCVYANTAPLAIGLHHCDRYTFVVPRTDRELVSDDVDAIVLLAHESAHGFQEKAGLMPVETSAIRDTRRMLPLERSADCWSGAATAWYIEQDMLDDDAVDGGRELMRSIGGSAGHGNADAREQAYLTGFEGGSGACNTILGRDAFPVRPTR